MWYVIQTVAGQERVVKTQCDRFLTGKGLGEIRILYYDRLVGSGKNWQMKRFRLFPGYMFLISPDNPTEEYAADVINELRKIPRLSRLMKNESLPVPVYPEEEEMLKRLTGDDGIADFSKGIIDGDNVIITSGSLMGLEGIIRKIDRHKRKAMLEISILGQKKMIPVGLEIFEKRNVNLRDKKSS